MAKTLTGIVTSDSRDKSITVTVTSRETHPIYKKQYTVNRKYQAHDENNEAHIGDKVQISEIRPVSKTKSFKLANIETRSQGRVELKDEVLGEALDEATKANEASA
ncbi:MAG TPA: 30S ribosomal protein S17 [Candidatus Saccharibacteria bacterium]|nr:30S ribosomal protein S17 [Candidatus Saccharibacteria bacterium]HRK94643.1 30S ribosomal protein S17 [Candidatus Saccharibacteria bacterium]